MRLDEQDIIAKIDKYKTYNNIRLFINKNCMNLSVEVVEYAWKKARELKRAEYRKYRKLTPNPYLAHIKTSKRKAKLEEFLTLKLTKTERDLVLAKLKKIAQDEKKGIRPESKRMRQYKYLDIIDKCNNTSTLNTYRTFTDITQYELDAIAKKIKRLNHDNHQEKIEKSFIQRDVEQQLLYQKQKDKMMKDFLSKGGKIKVYDFGL